MGDLPLFGMSTLVLYNAHSYSITLGIISHFMYFISGEELSGLRESEEKLKHQQIEAARRENILVMRLTTKEQEMQECAVSTTHPRNILILEILRSVPWVPCILEMYSS